jgi:muconolactone delta-isomerase
MTKHDKLIVERRDDGRWDIRKPHPERASAVEDTQAEALARGRELAREGDIKIIRLNGHFTHVRPPE